MTLSVHPVAKITRCMVRSGYQGVVCAAMLQITCIDCRDAYDNYNGYQTIRFRKHSSADPLENSRRLPDGRHYQGRCSRYRQDAKCDSSRSQEFLQHRRHSFGTETEQMKTVLLALNTLDLSEPKARRAIKAVVRTSPTWCAGRTTITGGGG